MGTGQIIEEVEESKPAPQANAEFEINGMTCGNCAQHVLEAIRSVPAVSNATVNLETQRASVRWAPGGARATAAVIQAVEHAGYEAKEIQVHEPEHAEHKLTGWRLNLWDSRA